MSTSLLYHAFGVRDYQYLKSNFVEGPVVFSIEQKPETLRCAACGSEEVVRQGSVTRAFHALPIGSIPQGNRTLSR